MPRSSADGPGHTSQSSWIARALALGGVVWCLAVGVWIWTSPVRYEGVRTVAVATRDGSFEETFPAVGTVSFAEISGLGFLPLLIPALIAGIGVWGTWRGRTGPIVVAATIMLLFAIVTGFSIGSAYMPAAAALVWAAIANADARSV